MVPVVTSPLKLPNSSIYEYADYCEETAHLVEKTDTSELKKAMYGAPRTLDQLEIFQYAALDKPTEENKLKDESIELFKDVFAFYIMDIQEVYPELVVGLYERVLAGKKDDEFKMQFIIDTTGILFKTALDEKYFSQLPEVGHIVSDYLKALPADKITTPYLKALLECGSVKYIETKENIGNSCKVDD